MSFLPHQCRIICLTALLFAATLCAPLEAQDDKRDDKPTKSVEQLVQDLGSDSFLVRRAAAAALRKAGPDAISALRKAQPTSTLDVKDQIQSILRELERKSFGFRLSQLQQTLAAADASDLPEWGRFSTLVGKDKKSVELYIRLLKSEADLFGTAMNSPGTLPTQIQKRAAELVQTTRPTSQKTEPFSVDSYAAVLLLAGNKETRLPGGTSTGISALLQQPQFMTAVRSPQQGNAFSRLVGAYILRDRIAPAVPISFARKHPMPEGPILARKVLQTARGSNPLWAMMLLAEQGSVEDLPLLESVFKNKSILIGNSDRTGYVVQIGDLALAVAIHLRGQDPRDFGFDANGDRTQAFRYVAETTGFDTEEARAKVHAAYAAKFPASSAAEKKTAE
ncbi:MAG: hypothetical protein GY903_09480 [Fuerstiella sp.]|nr:hypothetical protein [Fuerstiella sp.]MCP4854711.1 hypothetical protein [Fuerstiella sp.]